MAQGSIFALGIKIHVCKNDTRKFAKQSKQTAGVVMSQSDIWFSVKPADFSDGNHLSIREGLGE